MLPAPAVAVGNKMAFFGGWDGETAYNDLWVYDVGELGVFFSLASLRYLWESL
jgi:hypothetical protein